MCVETQACGGQVACRPAGSCAWRRWPARSAAPRRARPFLPAPLSWRLRRAARGWQVESGAGRPYLVLHSADAARSGASSPFPHAAVPAWPGEICCKPQPHSSVHLVVATASCLFSPAVSALGLVFYLCVGCQLPVKTCRDSRSLPMMAEPLGVFPSLDASSRS